jgi:hypothetical protein
VPGQAEGAVIFGAYFYLADQFGLRIARARVDALGQVAELITEAPFSAGFLCGIAVADDFVYWSSCSNLSYVIWRAPRCGGPSELLAMSETWAFPATDARGLVVVGQSLLFGSFPANINRIPR